MGMDMAFADFVIMRTASVVLQLFTLGVKKKKDTCFYPEKRRKQLVFVLPVSFNSHLHINVWQLPVYFTTAITDTCARVSRLPCTEPTMTALTSAYHWF